jgi:hypothetical protein
MSYGDQLQVVGYVLEHDAGDAVFAGFPWLGPAVFKVIGECDRYADRWGEKVAEAMVRVTDDEIAEYIEGVGSNQAFFMVSEVLKQP